MLNMVNRSEEQVSEGEKKTSGEIGLSGSMTRQVSPNPFRSPLRPRCRLWVLRVLLIVALGAHLARLTVSQS